MSTLIFPFIWDGSNEADVPIRDRLSNQFTVGRALATANLTPWGKLFKAGKIAMLLVKVGSKGEDVVTGFRTFDELKKVLGSAGENKAWYHIVEQSQVAKYGFSVGDIQNLNNVVAIPSGYSGSVHSKISGFYSSKQPFTNGKTVREWLSGKSFEYQFEFGLQQLKKYGTVEQTSNGWVFKLFE
ncbi:hypothetical protein ACFPVX_10470 [Cohnella faecalis]|uniref:hypothetical protein n=1 Tax=Cohnella faecalis TaxID=2315694 RepID=UPI0011C21F07|nr:hypothetical protein [Cohnella faecalis]